jgi:hypothetical protein
MMVHNVDPAAFLKPKRTKNASEFNNLTPKGPRQPKWYFLVLGRLL